MRTIEWTNAIKKDYRRIKANPKHAGIDAILIPVLSILSEDGVLPDKFRDHALVGNWKGYRECHIKPDLLLIYRIKEPGVLRLARLASHAELLA